MAEDTKLQGTNIASRIVPFDSQDTFPTHEAFYGRGGYRTVEDIAGRDAIPEQRLEEGMLVYCKNDPTGVHTYRYMGMKEGTSIRIWKELKLEGTGVPIYTNANVEEMREAGVNVDEMDYITIPDDNDIEGEVTNKTYETTQNGTYVDILFKAIRALQSEVARLKNSFLYGIESYSGKNTAMSAISADLEKAIEEEPLWAVEEDGLSSVYDLFEAAPEAIPAEFEAGESSTVVATEDHSGGQYYVTIDSPINVPVTWDAIERSEIGKITDSKLFLYLTTTGENNAGLKYVVHIQEDRIDGTSRDIDFDLRPLITSGGITSSSNVYNTLIVISRKQKVATSAKTDEEGNILPPTTEYYGSNFIWISVSDPVTNSTIKEGYWKDNTIYDDLTQVDEDTVFYDGILSLRSIDFYSTVISKFHLYSKYQDFTKGVIPSKPSDDTWKFKAAHITIRSVDTFETLKELKDKLLNNELILVESSYTLYIKIDNKLVAIGSQSSPDEGPSDDGDSSKDEDTGMTKTEIIQWLSENGIVVTENGGDLVLNDIADITFKHEGTKKTFKFTVDEEGNLSSQEIPAKTISEDLKDYTLKGDMNLRGFIAQYRLRSNVNQTGNAKLKSDRLKIGSFYAPLSGDVVHGCTHSFIELENTSDIDIPLKGIYLHVTKPVINSSGDVVQSIYSLELTGIIPSGGTYLIRGARHAEDEDVNAFIKVKTYDQEWYVDSPTVSDKKELLSLEILENINYEASGNPYGHGICLTYGNSGFTGGNGDKVGPRTQLVRGTIGNEKFDSVTIIESGALKNKEDYPYCYHKNFIDGICYYFAVKSGTSPYWATNAIGKNNKTMSNVMYRNMFELDPANQAYQALNSKDSSRRRWDKNGTDVQLLDLSKEYISFPKTEDIYPLSKFTPKASWEHRNVCTDKSKLDPNKPNMVTCSFGINIYTTRCFNWISLGYFDEYIWIKKTKVGNNPVNESWKRFESYKEISEETANASTYPRRKEFSVTVNNAVYARITGRFPADNSFYTAHKVIIDITGNPVSTNPEEYTYIVGRADKNGNPDPEHISREQTFTLYPTSYTTKIYQITDQQGFHWIEYQVWAAAADKLNEVIASEVASSNIIPILVNTGDMTQNGTRINEWFDYYQAGRNLFDHLEQMNCVGNNDLCNTDINALGTGDDEGKSNSFYFHVFYCYEVDVINNIPVPLCSGRNDEFDPKYIPSLYYFDSTTDRFLVINSELTSTTSKNWFNLIPDNNSNTKYINIYTGWGFDTSNPVAQDWYGDDFVPVYKIVWNILNDARTKGKKTIAICHEMPFTVITHASLATGSGNELVDRSISSSKLVGSHLNQIHAKELSSSEGNGYTMKGTYWFSRLLEYFNVKLVIGGHKHTYACTYPIRENYNYLVDGNMVNSLTNKMVMTEDTLREDPMIVFDGQTSSSIKRNLTRFPYIKKDDFVSPTNDSDHFFPSTNLYSVGGGVAYVEDLNVNSSNFVGGNFYKIVQGQFVAADTFTQGTTYYKKLTNLDTFGGIVYFMCQATGYKLKSNKELPSVFQTFSKIIPMTDNAAGGDSPNINQLRPMFAKITVQNGSYSITLCRLENIMTEREDQGYKFTQTAYGKSAIKISNLVVNSANNYGDWIDEDDSYYSTPESRVLFNNSYFTD